MTITTIAGTRTENIACGKINKWFDWSIDRMDWEDGTTTYEVYVDGDCDDEFPTLKAAKAYAKNLAKHWND